MLSTQGQPDVNLNLNRFIPPFELEVFVSSMGRGVQWDVVTEHITQYPVLECKCISY